MKAFLGFALLVFVIVAGWRIGSTLNSDALGMAVGMFFGILAGIPTALLVLLSGRRQENQQNNRTMQSRQPPAHGQMPYQQPPVIIVTSGQPNTGQPNTAQPNHAQSNSVQPYLGAGTNQLLPDQPAPSDRQRKFRVVGESEEWLDEW